MAIRAAIGAASFEPDHPRSAATDDRRYVGVLGGISGGFAASSVLETALYEVKPRDPLTFAIVGLVLLAICGVATYIPARRAVRMNPSIVLNEP